VTTGTVGRPAGRPVLTLLLLASASALLALSFLLIGNEAGEGDTRRFDMQLLLSAQALRVAHPGVANVMRDFSGLGSTGVITLFTVLTVGYLVMLSRRRTALLVAISVLSGTALVSMFKLAFGRVRPDAAYADFTVAGLSFPSGHASMSAIVFLTLGALVASTRRRRAERLFILATAALMAVLVGVSRGVLGVHWATDILGGWAFGAAWAALWLLLDRWWGSVPGGRAAIDDRPCPLAAGLTDARGSGSAPT